MEEAAAVFVAAFFAGARFVGLALFGPAALDPALFAAHRFLSAATIAALPSTLSFRFAFDRGPGADSVSTLAAAQRRFWASAIRARPSALIFLPLRLAGVFDAAELPLSMDRSSAICSSIRRF